MKPARKAGLNGWWVLVAGFWTTVFAGTFLSWLLQ